MTYRTARKRGRLSGAVASAIALASMVCAIALPASASAFNSSWGCSSLSAFARCWESGTTHTWAVVQASHPGGSAPSLCAYITNDTNLDVIAGSSGCGYNVSTYTACYGVNSSPWLAMVEHASSGHVYTVNGYADTFTTAC
jgi:hypothetical protein